MSSTSASPTLPSKSPSPLLRLPATILVDAIAAPFLSDSDIVQLAATCRSLAWLAGGDCDRSCNLEPVDIKEPMQTPITIPWRRRCQPPFARLPAGGILGGGADPAAWARLSHVLSVLPSFGPSPSTDDLPALAPLQEAEGSSPSSDDDEDDCNQDDDNRDDIISVRRCLKRAPVLTILRGFDVFPSPREPQVATDAEGGRTFEAWFRCDAVATEVAGTCVGGVLMGFHICNDQDGFATANLTPYRGRCGNAYRNSRLALLGVHPVTGCVFSEPPTVSFRAVKLTGGPRVTDGRWHHAALRLERIAGSECWATLFVDGVQVDTTKKTKTSGRRGSVTVGTGAIFDQFGLLPEHALQRIIALPFKGKIAAARVWGRAVQNVGALFEMKEDAGPGHVVLDDAGCAALLQRAADLRKGRRVSWTMRERVDSSKTFGFDDGIVCYFPILSDFCERV